MYAKTTLTVALALLASTAFAGDETKMEGATGTVPSFTTLDANRDGSVSKEEAASIPSVVSHWDSLDADKNGSLSSAEFANVGSSTEDTSSDESKY